MTLTPKELRGREDAILDALEHQRSDRTFLNRLYRDGVPTPEAYLGQRVRVLFVFREPNMRGHAYARDMRDEVRDVRFRPLVPGGTRKERSLRCWWNWKAGMFAHAVAAALEDELWAEAHARFRGGGRNHEVVNRFAYIQIKKVGGGGTSNDGEIRAHAERYASTLKAQIDLYRPHLVVGCGVGKDSPARLLAAHVLASGRERVTSTTGMRWWEFPAAARPRAMVQVWHPAWRGSRLTLYQHVWNSVHEVADTLGLGIRR